MTRFNLAFLFALVFSFQSFCQKLELGRVKKEELMERQNPKDSTASATFLFKKAATSFKYSEKDGFVISTTFKVKLKIYKKEGLKWANFKIPYYVGYQNLVNESIDIKNAYTYNLENDKIVKSKVTAESKFHEKINENWESKTVTFPNVKEGSIIELEYDFNSPNIEVFPEFQYQHEIPVNYAQYITEIPNFYVYNVVRKGYVDIKLEQKAETKSQSFEGKTDRSSVGKTLTYGQIITNYSAANIPALKEEDFVNNIENYYGKIEHELKMIQYPDEKPKQISTTWEAVAKSIYEDKNFNESISKFDYFENDVKSTINGLTSNNEKAKKIFSFVKSRMNWNGKYGYYPKRKPEVAYAEKVGSDAEINLMLINMLRMVGIDANPVIISTRENGFATFPNRTLLNYVIASVTIDGKTTLLDATSKYADFNILPIRDLNWYGRLIKNDGTSTEIDLMPKSNSSVVTNIMSSITEKGEAIGKIKKQYFDYNAFVFREKYNGIAKESYIEKLKKNNSGLEIEEYDVQNSLDLNLPINENYNFTSTNSVEIIGDKIYVSPFLFFAATENPFKQENREYPVDFVFPNQEKFIVSLTIPKGYTLETLPQPNEVSMPDKIGSFKYSISNNGDQIQLLYVRYINQAVINPEYYEALKNFYKEIVNKQSEKIVLKKV